MTAWCIGTSGPALLGTVLIGTPTTAVRECSAARGAGARGGAANITTLPPRTTIALTDVGGGSISRRSGTFLVRHAPPGTPLCLNRTNMILFRIGVPLVVVYVLEGCLCLLFLNHFAFFVKKLSLCFSTKY